MIGMSDFLASNTNQSNRGHREKAPNEKRTTTGDNTKIGTIDVFINGKNEGPMTFDKSAKEKKIILMTQ